MNRPIILLMITALALTSCQQQTESTSAVREVRGRKETPRPLDPESQEEMRRLEGTWLLVSAIDQGTALPPERLKGSQMMIQASRLSLTVPGKDGKPALVTGVLRVDARSRPKRWDERERTAAQQRFLPDEKRDGIYELNGDELRIAFPVAGIGLPVVRPDSFEAGPRSGVIVLTYRRKA